MLVNLSFNLVYSHRVDLSDLGSARDSLSQDHVQKSQLTVDGSLDDKVVFAAAYHRHVDEHVLETLFHPVDLGSAIQAVLTGTLLDELVFLDGQVVILLRLDVVFPGDQLVFVERFLLLIGSLHAFHLGTVF